MSERIPGSLMEALQPPLEQLKAMIDRYFDPDKASAIQHQISNVVKSSSRTEIRSLTKEILDESGPLALMNGRVTAELGLLAAGMNDVVGRVAELCEKVEASKQLAYERDRGTRKGGNFEEVLMAELQAIFGALGDSVHDTRNEYGATSRSKAGDFVVTINPDDVGGSEVRLVIEAKTGKLSLPRAQSELNTVVTNREAVAGVLVFDGATDAPLGGRQYCQLGREKFIVVFDKEERDPLALEVACRQARGIAMASSRWDGHTSAEWLAQHSDSLRELLDDARAIKRGSGEVRRGISKIDDAYLTAVNRIKELLLAFDSRVRRKDDEDSQK